MPKLKYVITDDTDTELNIHQKLTQLERQIDTCNKKAIVTAITLQADLSYYLHENKIKQEDYFEYTNQLSFIVKTFLKKCDCK